MENMVLSSISENSMDPYTCAAKENPYLACLDIAAPSTLSGTINGSYSVDSEGDLINAVSTTYLGVDATSTNLFGGSTQCDGKTVGDGVVSVLDMNVLMWFQFRVPPYNTLSSNGMEVSTVQGETLVGHRCEDDISRIEYLSSYDISTPCSIPRPSRRRLDDTRMVHTDVYWHHNTEEGSWFHIRFNRNYIAVELIMNGIDSEEIVAGTNAEAPDEDNPDTLVPTVAGAYEVRFARHLEHESGPNQPNVGDCGIITPLVTPDAVMYRNTIGIGQVPTVDRPLLCPFDVFVWAPNVHTCTVSVAPGSRAMDGVRGSTQEGTSTCTPHPYQRTTTPGNDPPPPLPPPSASPKPPPPSASPKPPPGAPALPPSPSSPPSPATPPSDDTRRQTIVILSVVVGVLACACCLFIVFGVRRRRDQEDEEKGFEGHNRPTFRCCLNTTGKD